MIHHGLGGCHVQMIGPLNIGGGGAMDTVRTT